MTAVAGVLHGARSSLLADEDGQILDAHSISAGLDYPGVGPEHALLRDTGRARYVTCTDDEALAAFHRLCRTEGIVPALESSHALARGARLRRGADRRLPVRPRRQGPRRGPRPVKKTLVVYLMAMPETPALAATAVEAGADVVELGFPFSDPLADGPVIRRAGERALAAGMRTRRCLDVLARDTRARRRPVDPDDLLVDPRRVRLGSFRRRCEERRRDLVDRGGPAGGRATGDAPGPARRTDVDGRAPSARGRGRPTAGCTSSR